ncbi:MAG: hypothetical protein HYX32_03130, partial [Actinobacteria bacterium]|nr:hypothetical protein [Actinomycetota bacterium]
AILDELAWTFDLVRLVCDDALARLRDGDGTLPSIPATTRAQLAARVDPLVARYRELWLRRNRPGGLDESCSRLLRLKDCYEGGSTDGVPMYG